MSVGTFNDFLFANTYGNSNTGPDQVQENSYPSLRKGNGKMLCSTCLRPLEHSFTRRRTMRYTAEDGPATETVTASVGRCLKDGHYSTIYPDEIVRNKQYCISEIRSALEYKADFSLASPRTRAYWKPWF